MDTMEFVAFLNLSTNDVTGTRRSQSLLDFVRNFNFEMWPKYGWVVMLGTYNLSDLFDLFCLSDYNI